MASRKKPQIREEIKKLILSDNNLMVELANFLNIRVYNLPQALRRNAKTTIQIDTIQFLSKLLNKTGDEIFTDSVIENTPLIFIKNEITKK